MAIENMQLMSVRCPKEKFLELAAHAIETKAYHPVLASEVIKHMESGAQYLQDQDFNILKSRMDALEKGLNLKFTPVENPREYELEKIDAALTKAESRYQLYTTSASRAPMEEDKIAFEKLRAYSVDHDHQYIAVHLGRIPLEALSRVTLYNNEPFVFTELTRNKHYVWIMYVCMKEDDEHFDEMFASLYYEDVEIPEETVNIDDVRKYCFDALNDMYSFVVWKAEVEQFEQFVILDEDKCVVNAFVSEANVSKFEEQFKDFEVERISQEETPYTPPTKLRNNKLVKPFEGLVNMYGLPRYGTFDPTTFFAISYSLLFGIMFGDLGQGLVLVLLGWYLVRKKGMALAAVLIRIGLASAFFGVIYGSVFGDETILLPILKPLGLPIHVGSNEMTQPLLIAAVGLGIGLIILSIVINIIILAKQKRFEEAVLSANGVCGLLFYGYVIAGAVVMVMGGNIFTPIFLILFIAIPLLSIMLHEPIHNALHKKAIKPEAGWGGLLTEGFFELFEVLLSFMANTLSFLRVGGFVLSHVGMMTVVMELRTLSGSAGILVLIIGNVIVIGLEGMIVGIQALRLEYYEMFSRYYESGGVEYKTL